MANVFYEESGGFKVGHILQETLGSVQIEDVRGKRSKVKSQHIWLRFEHTSLDEFLTDAQQLADEIDIEFLWSCCEEEIFSFESIAQAYFGTDTKALEKAAIALRLFSAPIYFYRKGSGQFKAAPRTSIDAAIAGQKKRQEAQTQMNEWKITLESGSLPDAFQSILPQLLHRPDKNSLEYKAVVEAAHSLQLSPIQLLEKNGAIPDIEAYFLTGFLYEAFPQGITFPNYPPISLPQDLPQASVTAFSIDDSLTTEIDDAFSLTKLTNGNLRVGIHIAVPALGILPNSPLEKLIRERLSTVYMPGDKITMLPDEAIASFSLQSNHAVPALSLYVDVTPSFESIAYDTKLEQIIIANNLRIETLSPLFNAESVQKTDGSDFPYKTELNWLWHYANHLKAQRTADQNHSSTPRVDYQFYIDRDEESKKRVRIESRLRGSPIDHLVSELMILANSQWGRILAEANIAAIYRTQSNGKVRMTITPNPHMGLGVSHYTWLTSPLRRAIDFFNQQQLLAHTLGLKPRFTAQDTNFFSIIMAFETAYQTYQAFQEKMEKYWCLRYIEQEQLSSLSATIVKEGLVRFKHIPLIQKIAGLSGAIGEEVILQPIGIDYLALHLECRVMHHV